ncbi:AraC family transcriptional regulator [Flavobacterium aquidurense]|uniref:AraC family transcriptional regulator n=1 Tax=Flavobacterium aquidurense TaxID=362413 RepID=UPI00285BA369|nr:AraC family transcriptional regulator [Flavobacterium aquidurense]MDR7371058.1 AraC-like DNA-binding protein [Flavobacterium aquidurense]
MKKKFPLLVLLCISQLAIAQKMIYKIPDSLQKRDYEYLDNKIYDLKKDSAKASVYLFTYLHKAKNEQNWKEIVNGYQNILHESPDKLRLIYADSMIYAAKQSNNNALIGSAYLSKGIVFYGFKEQNSALDNYIIANSYISKTNDKYLIYKVKYNIAQIKYYLGFYDEAISLLKECVVYFKSENSRPYLNSLHSLGLCYNKIGNYGLCSQTNDIGLAESKRLSNTDMVPYFIHSEGINNYFKQNYTLAISQIKASLENIIENKDFANESVGYFYIGKSLWSLKKQDEALIYFKKVDQIYNDKGYLRPDLREVYELLITYYKTRNEPKTQLYYIDQLLKADHSLNETYKYLIGKIHKEYDTKVLLAEKERINDLLQKRKYYDLILAAIILILFVVLIFLTYRHFENRKIYKQKFEQLILKTSDINQTRSKTKATRPEILDINPEAVDAVLKQLEKFESTKKFLEKDISLVKLSASFNSNTKYLSKIIFHYKDKGFVEYINDLKIDHLITLLQNDKQLRNYTNKALAEEVGFTSTQRFASAFLARTEMPTVFFIEHIKRNKD